MTTTATPTPSLSTSAQAVQPETKAEVLPMSTPAYKSEKHIKQYKNRKLYDMDTSQYVNLTNVMEMVKQGCKVSVLEAPKSKGDTTKDITILTKVKTLNEICTKLHAMGKSVDFLTEADVDSLIKKASQEVAESIRAYDEAQSKKLHKVA